jgi:hypothetical protein
MFLGLFLRHILSRLGIHSNIKTTQNNEESQTPREQRQQPQSTIIGHNHHQQNLINNNSHNTSNVQSKETWSLNQNADIMKKQRNDDNHIDQYIQNATNFVYSLMLATDEANTKPLDEQLTHIFRGRTIPRISIQDYIFRIVKYINRYYDDHCPSPTVSTSTGFFTLLGGFVLLERLTYQHGLRLDNWTIHRALITSVLLAHKILEDDCASNRFFSKIGGISSIEINILEMVACRALNFQLALGNRLWVIANSIG